MGLRTLVPLLLLFLRSLTFLAQEEEEEEPGLLHAQVLHALLGQLHVGARKPEACGSDDEGGYRDREKGAATKEK